MNPQGSPFWISKKEVVAFFCALALFLVIALQQAFRAGQIAGAIGSAEPTALYPLMK